MKKSFNNREESRNKSGDCGDSQEKNLVVPLKFPGGDAHEINFTSDITAQELAVSIKAELDLNGTWQLAAHYQDNDIHYFNERECIDEYVNKDDFIYLFFYPEVALG